MKKLFILVTWLLSLVLRAQDISFNDIKDCSKYNRQKAFIATLVAKKFVLLKKDSTNNGSASYYAFNRDSSKMLITIHSYNMVDFSFASSKNKTFLGLKKEIQANYKDGCFGSELPNHIKSGSFNVCIIDFKTKAIFYSEESNPEKWHLIMISPYPDVFKINHSKQEGINCDKWYSVCE